MDKSSCSIPQAIETLRVADPQLVEGHGYRLEPCNYYSPLNSLRFLDENQDLWAPPFIPLEIDWRIGHQLSVAREISKYVAELADIPDNAADGDSFYWNNNFWNGADALVQYGLLRSRQPTRLVEVGCGFSSLLVARALGKNHEEGATRIPDVTLVEPYPRPELLANLPSNWRHLECILQRCPLDLFDRLGRGDILFYDGSHCSHTASDVNWFFFRILPRLRDGVLIHLHDIFLPLDYPREWLFDRRQSWNEQFLLQAFLMNNSHYRIEIANSFLCSAKEEELRALYGDVQPIWGGSFWMIKTSTTLSDCP